MTLYKFVYEITTLDGKTEIQQPVYQTIEGWNTVNVPNLESKGFEVKVLSCMEES